MSRLRRVALWTVLLAGAALLELLFTQGPLGRDSMRAGRSDRNPGETVSPPDDRGASLGGGESPRGPASDEDNERASRLRLTGLCLQGGIPVSGATVLAHSVRSERQAYLGTPIITSSDKDGRYVLNLAPGPYVVVAQTGSERSRRMRLELAKNLDVDLLIGPGPAELRVRFVGLDATTPDASRFQVHNILDPGPALGPDDEGVCVLRNLYVDELCKFKITPSNGYFVRPHQKWAEGKLGEAAYFDVWIEDYHQETVVEVGQFAKVRGKVLVPEGAAGDVAIEVHCTSEFKPRATVSTSAGGSRYEMQVLPGQICALFATSVGAKSSSFGLEQPIVLSEMKAGEVRELDLTLMPLSGRICGSLLDGHGAPVPESSVHGSVLVPSSLPGVAPFRAESHGRTDSTGAFVLNGIHSGVLYLHADVKDRPDIADPVTLIVPGVGGGVTNVGTLVAPHAATLRGRITGKRPDGLQVHAAPRLQDGTPDYAGWRTTTSDERGEFVFERMTPGDQLVYVGGMDYFPVVVHIAEAGEETTVAVPAPP